MPAGAVSVSVASESAQTDDGPVIMPATGAGFTVMGKVVVQPVGSIYVMVLVPAVRPLTTPVDEPIVATAGAELVQVPLPASVSVSVADGHTVAEPEIAAGSGLTVTMAEAMHP